LINSELASLQEKLEETMQKNDELDQHLVNKKSTVRQQVHDIIDGNDRNSCNNLECLHVIGPNLA
jgi:hypothetical protein